MTESSSAFQTTIASEVGITGVGLHSGEKVSLWFVPGLADEGIVFYRTDVRNGATIPAVWDRVSETRLCTGISNDNGVQVLTVEHLMSAAAACGVSNLRVYLDGGEVPVMDGSAAEFMAALLSAGTRTMNAEVRRLRIERPVRVEAGDACAMFVPDDRSSFSVRIDFPDTVIGCQDYEFDFGNGDYASSIAPARTFGMKSEIDFLRSGGRALGGSLDNAVVVDGLKILNPDGLRFSDEFVRHKVLDAIGDISLAGARVIGRFIGIKSGHALNNQLLRSVFSDSKNYSWQ